LSQSSSDPTPANRYGLGRSTSQTISRMLLVLTTVKIQSAWGVQGMG
jgi:hypothetical protein